MRKGQNAKRMGTDDAITKKLISLTDEHRAQMAPHVQKWIEYVWRTTMPLRSGVMTTFARISRGGAV